MTNSFLNKKMPTLLGVILIVIGLSVTTLLTNNATTLQITAQENKQPQEVRITNITSSSITISYETSSEVNGYINYGETSSLGITAFDENDTSQKLQKHIIHSITLQNLNPSTKYFFSIISGGETYLNNNNQFEVTTSPNIQTSSSDGKIYGKVMLPNSNPPHEAIVYVSSGNSQVLSSLTKPDGSFSINLEKLLNNDLLSPLSLSKNSTIKMLILGDTFKSNVILYYSQVANMPIITLSNNYDFREIDNKISSPSANFEGFPTIKTDISSKTKSLQILAPSKNQSSTTQTPIIKGEAAPNQNIQITIHSDQVIKASVSSDANGNWSYQPTTPLDPGTHTITIVSKDSTGKTKTITQNFTVSKQEESPSPTNTPTITNTNTSPTILPTISDKPLPENNNISIITAGIVGLLITVVGGLIFLLSRKGI